MTDIKTLRELASKATPGPWATLLLANGADVRAPHASGGSCWIAETRGTADAELIAACSPQTILALCDVVEAAQGIEERASYSSGQDFARVPKEAISQLRSALEAMKGGE